MHQRRRINAVTTKPVLAVLMAGALAASATAVGIHTITPTQATNPGPVNADIVKQAFDLGQNVHVDDPAIGAQGAPGADLAGKVVKEFSQDKEFSMFALTWENQKNVAAYFRGQRADGSWTPWYDAEPLNKGSEKGSFGTEPIYIEPTKKVQVSVLGLDMLNDVADTAKKFTDIKPVVDKQGPKSTKDVSAVFIDGGAGGSDINLTAGKEDATGMPKVVTRQGWGADESLHCQQPEYDDHVSAAVIHHTAGSNNYTPQQSASIVRGIYQYHAQTLGWCDIGYNALVDKYGTIFEGRAGGLNKNVQGAHAGGFNQNTFGISMIGDYTSVTPPEATLKSVGEMVGWRAKVAGFDPKGHDTHYSEGTVYSKYSEGTEVKLPNIFAHRDVGTTTCPGDAGYAQMDKIRNIAEAKYKELKDPKSEQQAPAKKSERPAKPADAKPAPVKPAPAKPADGKAEKPAKKEKEPAKAEPAATPTTNAPAAPAKPVKPAGNSKDTKPEKHKKEETAAVHQAAAATTTVNPGQVIGAFLREHGIEPHKVAIEEIPSVVPELLKKTDGSEFAKAWKAIEAKYGQVLGDPRGGAADLGPVSYVPFTGGIMTSPKDAGTHALWGAIADAWAAQGLDQGSLGLPLNEEYKDQGAIRVDFQHGAITFDPRHRQDHRTQGVSSQALNPVLQPPHRVEAVGERVAMRMVSATRSNQISTMCGTDTGISVASTHGTSAEKKMTALTATTPMTKRSTTEGESATCVAGSSISAIPTAAAFPPSSGSGRRTSQANG